MTVTKEKFSNDIFCIEPFKLRFLQKVKDFGPSYAYNADESELFWACNTSQNVVSDDEKLYLDVR